MYIFYTLNRGLDMIEEIWQYQINWKKDAERVTPERLPW
jgi:hypothetical protein